MTWPGTASNVTIGVFGMGHDRQCSNKENVFRFSPETGLPSQAPPLPGRAKSGRRFANGGAEQVVGRAHQVIFPSPGRP
jgi:hypothetical protein